MALYNCPGCQQPISETQPLDHCVTCFAMNERQRRLANGTVRRSSAPEPRDPYRYMALLVIFRVPREAVTPRRREQPKKDVNKGAGF